MSNNIEQLKSKLADANKHARALRDELRQAQEAEIASVQKEIIEAIENTLFPATHKEKVEETLTRFQAIKEVFEKQEILENLRESASKYAPELGGELCQENDPDNGENLPHKDDENAPETGKHSVADSDFLPSEDGHENAPDSGKDTSDNPAHSADEPRHNNGDENGEQVVTDFDENSANEASEDDTNLEFSPSNDWHENTHDWGGNHDAF